MTQKSLFFMLFLACLCCFGKKESTAIGSEKQSEEIKVMAWNIWHGGKGERLPIPDARAEVIKIIKKSEADVVLMIETYGAAPMIAKELGFRYKLLSSNLCIFSRFPITDTYTFADKIAAFNFGGVRILVNDEIPVVLFDTWLHYLPDTRLAPVAKSESEIIAWEKAGSRDNEISAILETSKSLIQAADDVPVIMGGDFNSHSHLDWISATKDMYHHGGAVVNWPISRAMLDAGFIDSYRIANPNPVTHPGISWLPARDAQGNLSYTRHDRIDYIYYKGKKLKVKESESVVAPDGAEFTFNGETFMFPSDHGFVLTTFKLSK